MGIPVRLEFDRVAFAQLEAAARRNGTNVRTLIETHILRALKGKRRYTRLTPEQQAELVELTEQGWSASELARRYRCSPKTVLKWRQRLHCSPRGDR